MQACLHKHFLIQISIWWNHQASCFHEYGNKKLSWLKCNSNFHKTFDFLIIFYLKLLCNNVTMYILYVLQNFSGEHNISQEEYINGTVYTGAL